MLWGRCRPPHVELQRTGQTRLFITTRRPLAVPRNVILPAARLWCAAARGTKLRVCADDHVSHTVVHVDGQPIPCQVGSSLLNALINAGRVVPSACGGSGVCHLCHVQVAFDARVLPPKPIEVRALGAALIAQGVRLSCQLVVTAPLRVTLMPLPVPGARR